MQAHPMITPLLPLRSPEEIAAEYPPDAAAAYTLIWGNTLAHLRSPCEVLEGIHRYRVGEVVVGLRTLVTQNPFLVPLLPEMDGQRVTKQSIPIGGFEEVGDEALDVNSVDLAFVPMRGRETDPAALVEWMDALRVVSPGRLGGILDEIESAGWVSLQGTQYRLTTAGENQLHLLDQAGTLRLNGLAIARWRVSFGSYLSEQRGLDELLAQSNRIFGTALSIPVAELEQMITGEHSAEEAYALRDNLALRAASSANFPSGMDPEQLLAQDDPLRIGRDRLESSLSEGRVHAWLCLSGSERIAIRLGAELIRYPDPASLDRFLGSVQFDARSRWLIGLGADTMPPSSETAKRAYKVWSQSR